MLKTGFSLVITLFTLSALVAQDYKMELWQDNIPNNMETGENETWDTTDLIRVGNVQKPAISVYLPPERVATGQAVVICPGGGYTYLSYQWEGVEIAKWLNSNGIAAIVLKYRIPFTKNNIIGHMSPLIDAKRAMRLVRYNAYKWNIDKNKIGIMGFSAGGHLASTLAVYYDEKDEFVTDEIDNISSKPNFAILIYPVISMYKPNVHMGSRINLIGENPDKELIDRYATHLHVSEKTPPAFLVHSSDDVVVPVENSILFYKALVDKGVPAELHIYPYGGHGYSLGLGQHFLNSFTDRCIDWLKWLDIQ